ncbi:SDR family NAD(P)-dependent oxidoreductase [Mucilaginibacter auburnensis]|uniref:NAD(P)-dependent dehydrogenase (Short-subunit alcohol dehydrogenase family) n=1 Tax=Mucilaginibacter auburnensis TaxID=1457233 RepID=A0A2H9VQK3_9SPHI|nr:SDR family oxidoreductase [Mucilaginibacter auburnensis]PJJ83099.1 NAD(P)-dependent dehydrogenase (short-subunit alcohol dehydrogenase family) [Mucilaginibacter auburnensis]
MLSLQNKKAVITGAGSGIGRAMAVLFAKQGAEVIIIDLNDEQADETAAEITSNGGQASVFKCDVANHQAVLSVFEQISQLDILVNNAGIAHIGKADNTAEADFDKVMSVIVKGAYNCTYAAIPKLKANGGGVILNISSVAALVGITERFAYSTAKGAIRAMTMSVAKDYLGDNIRCNAISPARVHTPFVDGFLKKNYPDSIDEMFDKLSKAQPIGRMGQPDEVATLALYLCSNEAAFITGADYPIDGGFTSLI